MCFFIGVHVSVKPVSQPIVVGLYEPDVDNNGSFCQPGWKSARRAQDRNVLFTIGKRPSWHCLKTWLQIDTENCTAKFYAINLICGWWYAAVFKVFYHLIPNKLTTIEAMLV